MNNFEFQKSYTSEFICSLFVALIFGWSDISEQTAKYSHFTTALVQFMTISCLMFCSRPFSGAFLNPLVTICMIYHQRISRSRGFIYLSSQFLGSMAGVILLRVLFPHNFVQSENTEVIFGCLRLNREIKFMDAFISEFLGGFLFLVSYYSASIDLRTNKQISELACGFVYVVLNLSFGRNMNIGINPFRYLAGAINNLYFENWAVYLLPSVIGALLAAHLFEKYLLVDQIRKRFIHQDR